MEATVEAAVERQVAGQGVGENPLFRHVLALLDVKPWTIDGLRLRLGVSRREIELAVQEIRLEGWPILTDGNGVRLTDDPELLDRSIASLQRRIVTQYLGVRAARRTVRRMREERDAAQGLTLFGDIAA